MANPVLNHRVVIAGGGAGGLELAARLGRRYGRHCVTLVDQDPFHIWKPSLHEVAAGTLDIHQEGLSYPMLAHLNRFTFARGEVIGVDRNARQVRLAAVMGDDGEAVLPERALSYDTLVVAIGSLGNFFGTPGAAEHAIALDTTDSAEKFRVALLRAMVDIDQARQQGRHERLHLVIVGGGATGVELAAELNDAGFMLSEYGAPGFDPTRHVSVTIVESGPRLLGPLPERVSESARRALMRRGIHIETGCRVAAVTHDEIQTADGRRLPADLCIWAAGISAPKVLATLGLPVNKANQLHVDEFLQTADANIYAMGDCAAAPQADGQGIVPARAQAAHQQASYLARQLGARIRNTPLRPAPFVYNDYGSLVSLGTGSGVGSLMGGLLSRGMFVSGLIARLMYMSLHLVHHKAILGVGRTASLALGRLLMRRSRPRVKLH